MRRVQKIIGEVLIPEARAQQGEMLPEADALALALELFYTALAMKPAHQPAGMLVARRFAERMGLDGAQVQEFALHKVSEAVGGDSE